MNEKGIEKRLRVDQENMLYSASTQQQQRLPFNTSLLPKASAPALGSLFIVSAPAGAGKTTLTTQLVSHFPTLELAISYTTRAPRAHEENGVHYHFISKEQFITKQKEGDFIEWVELHGHFYGSCRRSIEEKRKKGIHLIMVIDTEGAKKVIKEIGDAISLFITVANLDILKKRLITRNSETEETLRKRLKLAEKELLCATKYDYIIVNDQFSLTLETLACIIVAEVHKRLIKKTKNI